MRLKPAIVTCSLAIVCSIYLHHFVKSNAWTQAEASMRHIIGSLGRQVSLQGLDEQDWSQILQSDSKARHLRLTFINPQGNVVADNHGDPELMDNHLQRPEIIEAKDLPSHYGKSIRRSRSVGIEYLYIAQAIYRDQQLLGYMRIALPTSLVYQNTTSQLLTIAWPLYAALVALCICWYALGSQTFTHQLRKNTLKQPRHETNDFEHVIWQKDRAFNLPAMLNSLSEGIIATNNKQQIVYLNQTAAAILRCSEEEALGKSIWDISRINIIPETINECQKHPQEISKEFQVLQHVKTVHYALHVSPIFQHNEQQPYGMVSIIDDISDQQRLDGMRRNFFTNVSHELKTPLAVIRGVIETMMDDEDMPQKHRASFLEKAFNQCARLNILVGDILTVSRLEDLEDLKERENVSLSGVLRECCRSLQNRAEQKHITIKSHLTEEPCHIAGDRELIQQVFDNLISNAINYSPEGSTVQVDLELKEDFYQIMVIDNGTGIPPQSLERIFERFYRVDKARSRQVGGTGLGLSIAKHAVALHGGKISVQSEVSKGSTFIVQLPIPDSGAS